MYELNGIVFANMISPSCLWFTQNKGLKTKTTESIVGGYLVTWLQLERVNHKPSPTLLDRESEWSKAKATYNCG